MRLLLRVTFLFGVAACLHADSAVADLFSLTKPNCGCPVPAPSCGVDGRCDYGVAPPRGGAAAPRCSCGAEAPRCGCGAAAPRCSCGAEAPRCGCGAGYDQVTQRVHIHYVPTKKKKKHHWCGPPPPEAAVFETIAVRRVPPPTGRTRLRFEREFQEETGEKESAEEKAEDEKECGGDIERLLKLLTQESRVKNISQRVDKLDNRMEELLKQLEKQNELIKELATLSGSEELPNGK